MKNVRLNEYEIMNIRRIFLPATGGATPAAEFGPAAKMQADPANEPPFPFPSPLFLRYRWGVPHELEYHS